MAASTVSTPSSAVGGVTDPSTNGGAVYGEPVAPKPKPVKKKPASVAARPQLSAFQVSPSVINPGQTPSASFQVKGRAPTIRLRLVVSWPGTANAQRTIDLGRQKANVPLTIPLTALADPTLAEGQMSIRIAGRDSAGRILRPGVHLSRVTQVQVR